MDLAGPKLRTGTIDPGPQVIKWSPRRNPLGHVISPARIWLYPAGLPSSPPTPADASLPVSIDWLEQLSVGDRIDFEDQRGSNRCSRVVEAVGPCSWLESDRTAYMTPETVLKLRSGNKKDRSRQKSHDETLGPLPAREQFLILKEGDTLILTDDQIAGRPAQFDEEGKLISPARIG